jgi:dTDP-4-dehydrorhamnose 3,5-epimerase
MKITATTLPGLLLLEPRSFNDERGYFFESYNKNLFAAEGLKIDFVQDNQSGSRRGVLRGMHFQRPPYAQCKLVRVLSGSIQDVVVDLRRHEKTFGQSFSIELSSENKKQLLVPKGFSHGFLVLSDWAEVLYKTDEFYHPEAEGGTNCNDPELNKIWQLAESERLLSAKDSILPALSDLGPVF